MYQWAKQAAKPTTNMDVNNVIHQVQGSRQFIHLYARFYNEIKVLHASYITEHIYSDSCTNTQTHLLKLRPGGCKQQQQDSDEYVVSTVI